MVIESNEEKEPSSIIEEGINLSPTKRLFALAAVAGLLGLMSCASTPTVDAANVKPVKERKKAPEFALKDVDGKVVRLSDYKGKVVLLNFWATWCGPCKVEIPWFVEFEKMNKDKGFAVIGVAMDEEGWEVVKPYIGEKGVNYRVVVGDDSTATLYGGVDSLPTTFLLDREGKIATVHIGLVSKAEYAKDIAALLAGAASSK
jgi:peroxiredoxin